MHSAEATNKSRFAPYVAALAADVAAQGGTGGVVRRTGTLASVDLSGFTKLSERLALADVTGAEEINAALNLQFGPLIEIALRHGGDVLQFGGDALLIWFEGEHHAARAGAAGVMMQASIRHHGRVETSAGVARLRMSVGICSGEFTFTVIGETHRELLVLGTNATRTVELEGRAGVGEVLACEQTAASFEGVVEDVGEGAWKLRRSAASGDIPLDVIPTSVADGLSAYEFVPPEMRPIIAADVATAEHRPVTVAFVLVPGTDRLTAPGCEPELSDLLGRIATVADRTVRDFGVCWSASDIAPDGFKLLFFTGAPLASEDDAGRVLRTADAFASTCGDLRVRIGVNTGLAFAADIGHPRRRSFAIIGDTVNLAARLMGKSAPGTALVSPSTIAASRSHWATGALVQLTVKGKRAPVSALPLIGESAPSDVPTTTPLVGRDRELATLLSVLDHVGRSGRSVEIIGEAGVGKSHLVSSLEGEAARRQLPVSRFVVSTFGGSSGSGALARFLRPETAPFGLVNAVPADELVAQRDRRHADIVSGLVAERFPRLLVVDDAQWLDEASHALLMQLVAARRALRWIIVLTRRPGDFDIPCDTEVEIGGLGLRQLLEIAPPAPGTGWLESDLERLAEEVGGNPMYFAEGVRLRPDAQRLGSSRSGELLAARLDHLDPLARRAARSLALIGRPVPVDVIADITGRDPNELGLRSFDGVVAESGGNWWFAFEPMAQIARSGLARRDRRTLHAATAELFIAQRTRLEVSSKEIAGHLAGAGNLAETWRWASIASAEARTGGSIREATDMLRLALVGLEAAPPDEIEPCLIEFGELLIVLGNFDEADQVLRDAWKRVGRDKAPPRALLVRARAAEQAGRFVAAGRYIARVRSDPASSDVDHVDAALLAGLVSHRRGRRRLAIAECMLGLRGARRLRDDQRRAQAHLQLEMIRWAEGHMSASRHESCAEELFRRSGNPRGLGYLLLNRGVNRLNQGPWDLALDDCFEAQRVLDQAGYLIDAAIAEMNAGVVLTRQGRPEETLARAERIAMVFNGLGWPEGVAYLDVSVGAALAQQGLVDEALDRLQRAECVFETTKNTEFIGEARRQQAIALLYANHPERALETLLRIDPEWFDLDPVLEVGVLWLRGHAALQLRDDARGRTDLEEAFRRAEARKLPYDHAMVAWSLEQQSERAGDPARAARWRTVRTDTFRSLDVGQNLPPLPI